MNHAIKKPVNGQTLQKSAMKWTQEALDAYLKEDQEKVSIFAPLALEFLGKSVLWDTNPLLLLPNSTKPDSMIAFAQELDVSSRKVKTIGLADVFERLAILVKELPLKPENQARLREARNGMIHVGVGDVSRELLMDALQVIVALLSRLSIDRSLFFGEFESIADSLLNAKSDEITKQVELKVAAAKRGLTGLKEKIGDEIYDEVIERRQIESENSVDPNTYGDDFYGKIEECPACCSEGVLIGEVDVDPEVEYEYDGPDEPYSQYVYWKTYLQPSAFICNVCHLNLEGSGELAVTELPANRIEVQDSDLQPPFDAQRFFNWKYVEFD